MTLVRITAEQSSYPGMLALLFHEQDAMFILDKGYRLDFYQDERVPMYRVLAEGQEDVVKYLTENNQDLS